MSQSYPGYANASHANHYHRNAILTAPPEEILIMLYEGAIRFLRIAKKAMEAQDIEKSHNHLIKSQNILQELMLTLDFEIGGEPAKNLYYLYEYFIYRLIQANLKKDITMVDEVLNHLKSLKKTWEEAIEIAAREKKFQPKPLNPMDELVMNKAS